MEEVPNREKVHGHNDKEKLLETETNPTVMEAGENQKSLESPVEKLKEGPSYSVQHHDASVRRILEIISDISVSFLFILKSNHC